MTGNGITRHLGKRSQTAVLLLINLCRVWNVRQDMRFGQLGRKNFELRELRSLLRRMHCSWWNTPAPFGIELHSTKRIRDDSSIDRFGRMTCPPADDVTAQP